MIPASLDVRRLPAAWRLVALAYVVLETALAAYAFSGEAAHQRAEITAFVLALPAMIVAIPVVYLVGAAAWSLRDQHAGHPIWPVTVTFALLFAVTATANVVLVRLVASWRVQGGRDELLRSEVSPPLR